jgi:hypothetical protein
MRCMARNERWPAIVMVDGEHQIPSDVRQVVERISEAEWESLAVQLGRHALHKSRRFYWRTGNSGELPCGEMTESIVSKAVHLWLTGRRKWNRVEYANLESFLRSVIDSLLSHFASSSDNRRIAYSEDSPVIVQGTPESELLEKERVTESDQILAEIIRRSQEDAVVLEIIETMRNGAASRREIVKATGRSADVIDNGLKRLRRLGANVIRSNKGYGDETAR